MFRKVSLTAAAVLALAGSAQAGSVTVSLIGKDAATIHADIRHAARRACADEIGGSAFYYDMLDSCMRQAVAEAEAKIPGFTTKTATAKPVSSKTLADAAPH